ncbi:MAG: RNA polymerase sigma-70 factor [Chitinophagaceae bacterium]
MATQPTYDDTALFHRIAGGDEAAFEEIFHRHRHQLFDYAMAVTRIRAEAEELVQDCFLKLWASRHRLTEIESPVAYLHRMARNAGIDYLRRLALSRDARQKIYAIISGSENTTEESVELSETQKILQQAIRQLTPHQQQVFLLSRYEGLNYEEIGERLGIARNTVKNQLVKALRRLREYLAQHYDKSVVLVLLYFLEKTQP